MVSSSHNASSKSIWALAIADAIFSLPSATTTPHREQQTRIVSSPLRQYLGLKKFGQARQILNETTESVKHQVYDRRGIDLISLINQLTPGTFPNIRLLSKFLSTGNGTFHLHNKPECPRYVLVIISPTHDAPPAGYNNASWACAHALPCAADFSYHLRAVVSSRGTPRPLAYSCPS